MLGLPLYNHHFENLYQELNRYVITKGYRQRGSMLQACVREFLFFIETKGFQTIQEVKASEIIAYYEYLQERPNQRRAGGLSECMIRHHLSALRIFFDYLLDSETIATSPVRLPKFAIGTKQERDSCTVEEIKLLYAVCETKRDKALLSIAYGCGLRRTEIQELHTNDVLLHKGSLLVREGKGCKSRTVPLSNRVIEHLREYLIYERASYFKAHNHEATPAFFITNVGTKMMGIRMNERLKALLVLTQNQALIAKDISLHSLRHSLATHLMDNGSTIEFVQQILGHSEMDTAHLYSKRRKQRLTLKNQLAA